jgi:hypothetical protein
VRVIQDELYLCSDCTTVACNGSQGADIEPEQLKATEDGLAKLGRNLVPDFDSESSIGLREFSGVRCRACGSHFAGYRARFAILGE